MRGQLCRGWSTVLSQMGILSLMQAGCVAWVWVLHVAGDVLRLDFEESVYL